MLKCLCICGNMALEITLLAVTTSFDPADIDIRVNGFTRSQNDNYFVFESLILLAHPYTATHGGNAQLCVWMNSNVWVIKREVEEAQATLHSHLLSVVVGRSIALHTKIIDRLSAFHRGIYVILPCSAWHNMWH